MEETPIGVEKTTPRIDVQVGRAAEWLRADAQRLDRPLKREEIERVAESLHLGISETAALFDILESEGLLDDFEEGDAEEFETTSPAFAEAEAVIVGSSLRSLFKLPLLNADEERTLGRKIALGREANFNSTNATERMIAREAENARTKLALSNVRLVFSLARYYAGVCDVPAEDLFQDGIPGLLKACDKYDVTLGHRFTTYATWWIRQSITRAIADRGKTIRLPAHAHLDLLRYSRAVRLLEAENRERHPTDRQIAAELGWDLDKAVYFRHLFLLDPLSLDQPTGIDDLKLVDVLPGADSPEDETIKAELATLVNSLIGELDEKTAYIIRRRFGIHDDGEGETLEEVARHIGVTRERVRQIQKQGLSRLRKKLEKSGITKEELNG